MVASLEGGQRGHHRVAGLPREQHLVGPFGFRGIEDARRRRRVPHGPLGVRAGQVARGHDGVRQDRLGRQPLTCHQQPLQAILDKVVDVGVIRRACRDDAADDRLHRDDLMRRGRCR